MKNLLWSTLFLFLPVFASAQLQPPTDLSSLYLSASEIQLDWQAPGGTEEPLFYWVYRNNMHLYIVEATQLTVTLPQPGTYTFSVKAFYNGGLSAASNEVEVSWFGPGNSSLLERFDSGLPDTWTAVAMMSTFTWSWEEQPHSQSFTTPHMKVLSSIFFTGLQQILITPEFDFTDADDVQLSFDHYMEHGAWGDEWGYVEYSLNGSQWNTLIEYHNVDQPVEHVVMDVGASVGGQSSVEFRFYFESTSIWNYEWRIDNVQIYADTGPDSPVVFDLIPAIVDIPAEGGIVYFDAHLENTLGTAFTGVKYQPFVELPNGQVQGPLAQINLVIAPFMNRYVQALALEVPAGSPAGEYEFIGRLGRNANLFLEDRFTFTKAGQAATAIQSWDDLEWTVSGSLAGDETVVAGNPLPVQSSLSAAYPNPFNAQSRLTLSLAAASPDARVVVYNVTGQEVAVLQDGALPAGRHEFTLNANSWASGVYFVRATVPGQVQQTQKIVLMR
ncbi:T9SS type A sorting domain-containing protein [bacterium]|nr:T9SS type A sorting domain-containing protein [bacterium]